MSHPARLAIALWALACLAAAPAMAPAQEGGAARVELAQQDSGLPVEITADRLRLDRAANMAVFEGNVSAEQGALRLTADRVEVEYGTDEDTGKTRVRRVRAIGHVVMIQQRPDAPGAEPDVAEAGQAEYDLDSATLVMSEDVMLVQGQSVITGDRLTYRVDTGEAVMSGNVTTLLAPSSP